MAETNSESNWKWLVGVIISLLAAGSGIVALLVYFKSPPQKPSEPQKPPISNNASNNTVEPCYISGTIYSKNSNQPLPNVEVGYYRLTKDQNEYIHDVKSHLANTDSAGKFEADCSKIEAENFPLRIVLSIPNSQVTSYQTNEYIQRGTRKSGLNLYVPDNLLKKPTS